MPWRRCAGSSARACPASTPRDGLLTIAPSVMDRRACWPPMAARGPLHPGPLRGRSGAARPHAGAGSKGERLYDWARFRLFRLQQAPTGCWCAASSPSRTRWHITSCSARPPPAWRPDRRSALAGRGVLRDGQAGGRAGRLRGAQLARLVPAHHLIDAGARLPGGDAGRTRLPKGGGRSSAFIAFSMPEIRRLITRFQVSSASTSFSHGRSGVGSIRPSPKPATGNDRPPNS